jgi:hypothetical protein
MKRRRDPNACGNCGGPCTADAVDNFGNRYKGCPRCWIRDVRAALVKAFTGELADVPKRRIRVRPCGGGPWCICDDWAGVGQMIEDDGEFEFSFVLMTDEQVEALGDFPGW